MTDKEWDEFVVWYKKKWPMAAPHRASIEQYFEYLKEKGGQNGKV